MEDPAKASEQIVTRKELYERAWTTPLETLAQELGVTSRKLIKILDELQIPYPPASDWKRRREGKLVFQRKLPKAEPGTPPHIAFEYTKKKAEPPTPLSTWHPVIAGWREERKALVSSQPFLGSVKDASVVRKQQILNVIFKSVEEHGIRPLSRRHRDDVYFAYECIEVSCTLREKKRRVATKRSYSNETFFDLVRTGDFIFKIESYLGQDNRIRRMWEDKPAKRLEDMTTEIVLALVEAAPTLLHLKQEELARAQKEFEERQRRQDAEAYRQRDERLWTKFVSYAERLDTLDSLRALVTHLEHQCGDASAVVSDRSITDWLKWVKGHIEEFDPLQMGPEKLFRKIAESIDREAPPKRWDD